MSELFPTRNGCELRIRDTIHILSTFHCRTEQGGDTIFFFVLQIADCCLVPQVFNARRFHVDLRPYPIILRIDRELEVHPAFRAAHPSNQPDCPPEAAK